MLLNIINKYNKIIEERLKVKESDDEFAIQVAKFSPLLRKNCPRTLIENANAKIHIKIIVGKEETFKFAKSTLMSISFFNI